MYRDLSGIPQSASIEAMSPEGDPLFVRAVARAVAVLTAFERVHKPMTLNELSQATGLERSATQRMIHTLSTLGLITRDADDRGYLPGKQILTMACSALRLTPVVQHAAPILLELRRRTRERVDMSLWDDQRLIYTARMPSKHEIFTATLTGHTVPVYCTAGGVAVLSCLPDTEIAALVARSDLTPFTPETVTTLDQVMELVEDARQRGHSLACKQLLRHEVVIGAPVMGRNGRPLGAIHIAGNLAEHEPEAFSEKFGQLLQTAATSISQGA